MIRVVSPGRFVRFLIGLFVVLGVTMWFVWGGDVVQRGGEVTVEKGETARQVWVKMVERKFTAREFPWRYHAWRQDAATSLKVGTYQLEEGERVAAVIDRMVKGETLPDELTITYPEGFTLEQIAARTANRGIGSSEEFEQTALPSRFVDQFSWLQGLPPERTLEGYLFPDTYKVFVDDTAEDVIQRMLTNFSQKFTEDLRTGAAAAERSIDEIVIMASIIEREVIHDDDMAMVSGVLWKRSDEGLGLDADATIRYAVNNWDQPLTVAELQVDSPYNTRRYRGLPPGPISNPGLRALIAAVRPQASEFYYYLSTPEGETIFSRTNDEHNQNKAKYLR